jgi:hypothetical protein
MFFNKVYLPLLIHIKSIGKSQQPVPITIGSRGYCLEKAEIYPNSNILCRQIYLTEAFRFILAVHRRTSSSHDGIYVFLLVQ